jgi:hypothetical protein
VTGFAIAFLHAAIPTHWLPFVLAGRAQRWSTAQTLCVTLAAGGGHVLFTTLLGVLVVWLGIQTSRLTGDAFPFVAGGVLFAFGLYYLAGQFRGIGHGHSHFDHAHHHGQDHGHDHHQSLVQPEPARRSDWAAVVALFAALTFSPCEGFLPVYLSGVGYGWLGFAFLSLVLAGGTILGMVMFTWLSIRGLERFKIDILERFERGVLGVLLCVLGAAVFLLERGS